MRLTSSLSIIATALLTGLSACSREDDPLAYSAKPSVYFVYSTYATSATNMDSLSYSFLEKNASMQKDTVWLNVRITGNATDKDRSYNIVPVTDKTTATPNVHYRLLPFVIAAGSYEGRAGIELIRDASLRTQERVLTLTIQPTADFPELLKDGPLSDGRYHSRNVIRINFSDQLIKPANWDSYLVNFFGAYSNTKFRFIANVLERSSFPTSGDGAPGFPRMQFYQNTVRNALLEYNNANGPLIDENGQQVVFP